MKDREYEAAKHEAEHFEMQFRGLRDLLVNLLGLAVFGPKSAREKEADRTKGLDPDFPRIVPLAYLTGQPEVLQHFIDQAKRRVAEDAATTDASFDAISAAILEQIKTGRSALPKDMARLLTDDLQSIEKNSYWNSEEMQQQLDAVGVRPRVDDRAVPHIAEIPKVFKDRQNGGSALSEAELIQLGERPAKRQRVNIDPAELEKYRRALGGGE